MAPKLRWTPGRLEKLRQYLIQGFTNNQVAEIFSAPAGSVRRVRSEQFREFNHGVRIKEAPDGLSMPWDPGPRYDKPIITEGKSVGRKGTCSICGVNPIAPNNYFHCAECHEKSDDVAFFEYGDPDHDPISQWGILEK